MGGIASTHRSNEDKDATKAAEASETQRGTTTTASPGAAPISEDVKMDEISELLGKGDSITEGQLGGLRVKDPEAWKGSPSPRPRSALKHGSSTASYADSEGSAGMVERTPSGRRMPRKVSFQVQGLNAPPELGSADGGDGVPAHKRVRGSEEFSMKFLVEKFYGKVLTRKELQPFFEGVDMIKLKNQQEALMLLVFGGQELLEDELPGLHADLRLIHLHLLFEGLNLMHWQIFADTFNETLDELHQIPEDVRQRAKDYMATTKHHFRPMEPHEWPPKVMYKGWTKRSCPFHTSISRPAEPSAAAADGADTSAASGSGGGGDVPTGGEAADDDEFILPGINSPPLAPVPAAPAAAAVAATTAAPASS